MVRRNQALPIGFMSLPLVLASPAARWGHQAVYVKSQQAMYVVGGQVSSTDMQITNDVLILPLNGTNPSFTNGPNSSLPPHAFASLAISGDESSLMVIGGMTSNCASDTTTHTLPLSAGKSWKNVSPDSFVRRRNGGAAWVNTMGNGAIITVGGIADIYSCASSTYAFPAADILSIPLNSSSVISTRSLPTSLTGSSLAVSDFAMTSASDGSVYLAGGQDSSGNLVPLNTIGKWTKDNGWTSQTTSGDIPSGRMGASLAAHPTLDVLVLHGGSTSANNPSTLLAMLNTTTWTWSTPGNLQPPSSSAAAYHSAVMTPSGVMITAFGLGTSGPPSDMYILDLRDPTGNAWTWKSYWKADMLSAYSTSTADISTDGSDTTNNGSAQAKKVTSIAVPIIVGLLVLVPLVVFFIRRKVRIARKRRLARHFSFSSQEDSGDFTRPFIGGSRRPTKTQYPFGRDANEKEGPWYAELGNGLSGLMRRFSRSPGKTDILNVHRKNASRHGQNWEEIDFGLGEMDEKRYGRTSRDSSFSATGSPPGKDLDMEMMPVAGVASTNPFGDHNETGPVVVKIHDDGTPTHDGQTRLLPALAIIPPTVPPTPHIHSSDLSEYPVMAPGTNSGATAIDPNTGLDWNLLAQELEQKPAFRSISPTSTLRSHSHGPESPQLGQGRRDSHSSTASNGAVNRKPAPSIQYINRSPSPTGTFGTPEPERFTDSPTSISPIRPIGPAPHLPNLEFQKSQSATTPFFGTTGVQQTGTITLVNPKTGRRTSETYSLPGSPVGVRSVSGPAAPMSPIRQLAGRRESAPTIEITPPGAVPSVRRSSEFARAEGVTYASASLQGRRGSALRIVNTSMTDGSEDDAAGPAL